MFEPLSIRLSPTVFKMLAKNQSPKESFARYVRTLQDEICRALEALDGEAVFIEDQWAARWRRRGMDSNHGRRSSI